MSMKYSIVMVANIDEVMAFVPAGRVTEMEDNVDVIGEGVGWRLGVLTESDEWWSDVDGGISGGGMAVTAEVICP